MPDRAAGGHTTLAICEAFVSKLSTAWPACHCLLITCWLLVYWCAPHYVMAISLLVLRLRLYFLFKGGESACQRSGSKR